MKKPCELLIFVEDPGALNFIVPLLPIFEARKWKIVLMITGAAHHLIGQPGRQFEQWPANLEVVPGEDAFGIWKHWAPRVLLVGTSENLDSAGFPLIELARRDNILSVGAIDASANARFRFRGRTQNPLAHAPNWVLVPDEATRQGFLDIGFSDSKIAVCGHPYFDFVHGLSQKFDNEDVLEKRKRLFPMLGTDPRPIWIFGTELSDGLGDTPYVFRKTPDYSLQGREGSEERTRIILEEWIDAVNEVARNLQITRPAMVVRLHPKENLRDYADYGREIEGFSHGGNSLEVVHAANAVFGMSSMLLVEALLLQRPTLSILPRESERIDLPEIAQNRISCVWTRPDLCRAITHFMQPNRALPYTQLPANWFGASKRVTHWLEYFLGF